MAGGHMSGAVGRTAGSMQSPNEAASALMVTLLQRPPFTDSAYSADSPVHRPLTSWTTLRALSWTATKNGSSGVAVITFMGHCHYPDQGRLGTGAPLRQRGVDVHVSQPCARGRRAAERARGFIALPYRKVRTDGTLSGQRGAKQKRWPDSRPASASFPHKWQWD